MKELFIYFLALLTLNESKDLTRRPRGNYRTYAFGNSHIQVPNYESKLLGLPDYSTEGADSNYYQILSNSLEKPVQEFQEYVPPQSVGSAIIPDMPPPAVPVNAAASNVPGNGNAIFLGSGSLGVIDLGGGAYALGSGGIGYSEIRRNPRPSIKASTLPPIQAAPNLLPAAVNSPEAPQQTPLYSYSYPPGQNVPIDQNGYEFLTPDRVGFGDPLPPGPLKTTNSYAVPTTLQIPQGISSPPPIQSYTTLTQNYQNIPQSYTSQPQTLTQTQTAESYLLEVYPKKVPALFNSSYLKK